MMMSMRKKRLGMDWLMYSKCNFGNYSLCKRLNRCNQIWMWWVFILRLYLLLMGVSSWISHQILITIRADLGSRKQFKIFTRVSLFSNSMVMIFKGQMIFINGILWQRQILMTFLMAIKFSRSDLLSWVWIIRSPVK